MSNPPVRDPAAEWLDVLLTDSLNGGGKFDIKIDDYSTDVSGAQDIIVDDVGTAPFTELKISKLGGNDGEVDIVRFDLTCFDDDFDLEIKDVRANDIVVFDGIDSITVVNASKGEYTITYTGKDGLSHTIQAVVGPMQVQTYTVETVDGTAGDDLMLPGYIDGDGDEIDGPDGDKEIILGYAGDDTIDGGVGNDNIDGGDDDDTILLSDGYGNDKITGGSGGTDDDTLDMSGLSSGVNVVLTGDESGIATDGTDTATFSDIENLTLTDQADTVDAKFETTGLSYEAGAGDDEVTGGSGADSIDGGLGHDDLDGAAGADTINGDDGDDTIEGGDGSDVLDGGSGADVIYGDRAGPTQSLKDTMAYNYAQNFDGGNATHFGDQGTGDDDDPLLLIDGDLTTELRMHEEDIFEYSFGQTVPAGTSITLAEFEGDEDEDIRIYVTNGTTDAAGDANNDDDDGVGYANTLLNGTLIYSGPSDSTLELIIPVDATHIQFAADGSHGGWAEIEFTNLVLPPDPGDDVITGGDGDDTIDAGAGNDSIDAGADDDSILASAGLDSIDGGTGADTYDSSGQTIGAATVEVDDTGTGSLNQVADGSTWSQTVANVENFVAGENTGQTDSISLTDAIEFADLGTDLDGLDDNSVGTYTPNDGGTAISFGGSGEPTLSDLLSGTYDFGGGKTKPNGSFNITSGDEDGRVGNISFENYEDITFQVVCFTSGTRIATQDGDTAVETLQVGDMVRTVDHGCKPIRWIGSRLLSAAELQRAPNLRPIRIRSGALGQGTPATDLIVSPQHRVLIRSKIAMRMFDSAEVLIAAKHLLGMDGIEVATDIRGVTYWHFMFDQHEIVTADGAMAEALYPGPEALKSVSEDAREELLALFPEADWRTSLTPPLPARPFVKAKRARQFLERSQRNGKPLVADLHQQSVPA